MANELLLVAGLNYAEYEPDGSAPNRWTLRSASAGPWREFSLRVARRALRADPSLRVTLLDFFKGTREGLALDPRGRPVPTVEDTPGPLNFANYRRVETASSGRRLVPLTRRVVAREQPHVLYFTGVSELSASAVALADYLAAFYGPKAGTPAERSISVTDVYGYLAATGGARPNTVVDLHVLSHGFAGGPILTNTKDLANVPGARDPLDKDGRRNKDFPAALTNPGDFKKAFATGATSRIWGCNAFVFMKKLVLETLRQKQTIRDPAAKRLQFTWNPDWVEDLAFFHGLLGGTGRRSDPQSVNDIVQIVRTVRDGTYMAQLAAASGQRVLGGLPGTYSDLDHDSKFGDLLLHVPMGSPFGDDQDFRGILAFYKDFLGTTFEPKEGYSSVYGRGFGVFT